MTLDELRALCEEAARDLVARTGRPHPPTAVLPLPDATKVTTLEGFPEDDVTRHDALSRFAADEMVPRQAPCFGFLAEAVVDDVDVLLVAYGARGHGTHLMAAPLTEGGGLGEFTAPEPLDPAALPFLRPLQHAADTATA